MSDTAADIRATFLFAALNGEQTAWLIAHSEVVTFAAGETIFIAHEPAEALWVLLQGKIRSTLPVGGREATFETADQPGAWFGAVPVEEFTTYRASAKALDAARMLKIPRADVQHMLANGFPIAEHLLSGLSWGVQTVEALTRGQEKLTALGKLAAGLAHELNNPAAAVQRTAGALRRAIAAMQTAGPALVHAGITPEQADRLAGLVRPRQESVPAADPLARADLEDEIGTWLDEHGVEGAWDLAGVFVEAGYGRSDLDELGEAIPEAALPSAAGWLGGMLQSAALAGEIEAASERISSLVGAVREYTYLDRAVEQEVDVRAGLDQTLKIFGYRLRGVAVTRDYDEDMPCITARGSELNQVWTNLIDNALDAMAEMRESERRLTIGAHRDGECVMVVIGDNGPGIPAEVQPRIFEPFFTTKEVGEGTGLGLDISQRIVAGHRGEIRVESRPGETRFRVSLPVAAG